MFIEVLLVTIGNIANCSVEIIVIDISKYCYRNFFIRILFLTEIDQKNIVIKYYFFYKVIVIEIFFHT